jgi:hypothetical protein
LTSSDRINQTAQLASELADLLEDHLAGRLAWRHLHDWSLEKTVKGMDVGLAAPFGDWLESVLISLQIDEDDAEQYQASRDDIVEWLQQYEQIQSDVQKHGLYEAARRHQELTKKQNAEARENLLERHRQKEQKRKPGSKS